MVENLGGSDATFEIKKAIKTLNADEAIGLGYCTVGVGGLLAGAAFGHFEVMGLGAATILASKIPIELYKKRVASLERMAKDIRPEDLTQELRDSFQEIGMVQGETKEENG